MTAATSWGRRPHHYKRGRWTSSTLYRPCGNKSEGINGCSSDAANQLGVVVEYNSTGLALALCASIPAGSYVQGKYFDFALISCGGSGGIVDVSIGLVGLSLI